MNPRQIAIRISAARHDAHMTQEKLSEVSGVSLQSIKNIETGKQGIKGEQVVRIAEALSVSCDYILTGRTPENVTVGQELGLSELAIVKLFSLKDTSPLFISFLNHLITDWEDREKTMEQIERAISLINYKRHAGYAFRFGREKLLIPLPDGSNFNIDDAIIGLSTLANDSLYNQMSRFVEKEVCRIAKEENNP